MSKEKDAKNAPSQWGWSVTENYSQAYVRKTEQVIFLNTQSRFVLAWQELAGFPIFSIENKIWKSNF